MTGNLMPTQRECLELLKLITSICEQNGWQYTLFEQTLWSAAEKHGFFDWAHTASIALLYDDYKKLYEYCLAHYSNNNDKYFIMCHSNCEEYNEFYFCFAKKSGVQLPECTKANEKYYSYYISVIPVFYAGNTKAELKKFKKRYDENMAVLTGPPGLPGNIHNFLKQRKRRKVYQERDNITYEKVLEELSKNHKPTKYVFIPLKEEQKGVSCRLETYKKLESTQFEDNVFSVIQDIRQWRDDFYGKKAVRRILETVPNRAVLEGPEKLRQVQLVGLDLLLEFDRICRKYGLKYCIAWGTLLGAVRHRGFIPWDDDVDILMEYEEYLKFEAIAKKELDPEKYFLQNQTTDVDTHLVFPTIRRQKTIYSKPGREKYNTNRGIALDILLLYQGADNRIIHMLQHRICKFYKRMTWAHMEHKKLTAISDKILYAIIKNKGGNKYSYSQFLKYATMNQNSNGNLTYLNAFRNPFGAVINKKETYQNLVELEFEGHRFFAPENYHEMLAYSYCENYMHYPQMSKRVATHLPEQVVLDLDMI